MKNPNSGTVSVSRELLVRLCNFHATGWEDIGPEIQELRATLAEQHIVCQSTACEECGGNGSYKSVTQVTQPADQQGEPFGYWLVHPDTPLQGVFLSHYEESARHVQRAEEMGFNVTKLYAQPATAKVVLPERKRGFLADGTPLLENLKWNACLDEVAKLNGGQS